MSGYGMGGMPSMDRGRRGGGFRSDGGGWQKKAQPPPPVQYDGDDGWDSDGEASTPANAGADPWNGQFQQNAAQTTYQNSGQSNYSQREGNSGGGRRGRGAGFRRGNNNRSSEDGNWRSSRDSEDNGAPNRRGRFGGHLGGDDEQEDGGRWNGFGGESNFQSDRNDGQGVTMLEVCSRDVGRIIGKGGMKIRELQDTSGARIKIQGDNDNGLVTPVELKGTPEAQAKAKEMIDELLESFKNVSCFVPLNESKNLTPANRPVIDWAALYRDKDKNAAKKWEEFPEVVKNFYIEDPYVANMHDSEVARIREENNKVTVKNLHKDGEGTIPNPVITFEQAFQHHPEILSELKRAGFSTPSPIQMQGWPIALQGKDLIGIAQTGTGKTIAFLLPAFIHIEGQTTPREQRIGPTVLVLSPTRELALQIEVEVRKYQYRGIKCCCIYGGGSRREQIATVSKGVEIIVATPGRLNDLINNKIIDVRSVTYLVLDEADRMLDMGFEPEIRKILLDIRPNRQTVMTSATWPEGVRRMAESYMVNPMQVFIGSLDLAAVHSVTQIVQVLADEEKRPRLIDFLLYEMTDEDKVIVFVGRKTTADDIASDFHLQGISCQCIHGDREQCDREQALEDFKTGEVRVLVATDVASRGLDVKDITYVFNFDFPRNVEDYVHRVGRTGRAGREGTAISLMTRGDWRQAKGLIDILVEANQEVPRELEDMAERFQAWRERNRDDDRRGGGRGRGGGGGGYRGRGGSRGGGDSMSGAWSGIGIPSFGGRGGRRGRGRRGEEDDGMCGFSF